MGSLLLLNYQNKALWMFVLLLMVGLGCDRRQKQHMAQLEQRLRESELQVHGALLGRGASYGDMYMLRLQVSKNMLSLQKATLRTTILLSCWLTAPISYSAESLMLTCRRLRGRTRSWGRSLQSAQTLLFWRRQRQSADSRQLRLRCGDWLRIWRKPARGTRRRWRNRKKGFVLTQHVLIRVMHTRTTISRLKTFKP